jgi:hypothetical protein
VGEGSAGIMVPVSLLQKQNHKFEKIPVSVLSTGKQKKKTKTKTFKRSNEKFVTGTGRYSINSYVTM